MECVVDTNVVVECHRTRSWRALAGGYSVETVEDCVAELKRESLTGMAYFYLTTLEAPPK